MAPSVLSLAPFFETIKNAQNDSPPASTHDLFTARSLEMTVQKKVYIYIYVYIYLILLGSIQKPVARYGISFFFRGETLEWAGVGWADQIYIHSRRFFVS